MSDSALHPRAPIAAAALDLLPVLRSAAAAYGADMPVADPFLASVTLMNETFAAGHIDPKVFTLACATFVATLRMLRQSYPAPTQSPPAPNS